MTTDYLSFCLEIIAMEIEIDFKDNEKKCLKNILIKH